MAVETGQVGTRSRDHVVQLYERDEHLSEAVGAYLLAGLEAGEAAVVVATEAHRAALAARLRAAGVDVERARSGGTLVMLDAADTLSLFLGEDGPDPVRFEAVIGGLIRRLGGTGRRVRAFGEMVALLWEAGQLSMVIALEDLWNRLQAELDFSLFCAYPAVSVGGGRDVDGFGADMCGRHSAVLRAVAGPPAREDGSLRRFGADLRAPGEARRFVVDTLEAWGRSDLVDDAALVVTELTANAVLHGRSDFAVTVSDQDGRVRIGVRDGSTACPEGRTAEPLDSSGRGLFLVAAIALRWGAEFSDGGKVVWAELGR